MRVLRAFKPAAKAVVAVSLMLGSVGCDQEAGCRGVAARRSDRSPSDSPDLWDQRMNRACTNYWGDREDIPLYKGGPYRGSPYYYGNPQDYRR